MPALIIKIKPKGTQKKPLMIVVTKKVLKLASERNLFKRRIKAIMRETRGKSENDYVVIATPAAALASFTELKEEIENKSRY